jgi:hypothetical protein
MLGQIVSQTQITTLYINFKIMYAYVGSEFVTDPIFNFQK